MTFLFHLLGNSLWFFLLLFFPKLCQLMFIIFYWFIASSLNLYISYLKYFLSEIILHIIPLKWFPLYFVYFFLLSWERDNIQLFFFIFFQFLYISFRLILFLLTSFNKSHNLLKAVGSDITALLLKHPVASTQVYDLLYSLIKSIFFKISWGYISLIFEKSKLEFLNMKTLMRTNF